MRHKKSTAKSITSNQLRWYDFILCYFSTKGFTLYQISKQRKEGRLDGHTRSSLYILTAKIASVASYRVWRKLSTSDYAQSPSL